jgi:hypothetical protein
VPAPLVHRARVASEPDQPIQICVDAGGIGWLADVGLEPAGDLGRRRVGDSGDLHERERPGGGLLALAQPLAVLRPGRRNEGMGQQCARLRSRGGVAAGGEFLAPAEVGASESRKVGPDHDVCPLEPWLREILHHQLDRTVGDRADRLCRLVMRGGVHADGDHHVGAHRPGHVHRDVVEDPAVGEQVAVEPHRLEGSRDRHRRAQRRTERSATEHQAAALLEIGGDAAERNRQLVEVADGRVGKRDPAEQQTQAVAGIESALQAKAVAQAGLELDRVVAVVLLAAERLQAIRDVRPQQQVPVGRCEQLLDLGRGHPGRVGAADEGARAGACDRVDRNPVLLQPLQDAGVREPPGRATAECQRHTRTRCRLLAVGGYRRQRQQPGRPAACDPSGRQAAPTGVARRGG